MSSPAAKPPDATIVVVREELERLLEGRELRNSQQLRKLLRIPAQAEHDSAVKANAVPG